MEILGVQIDRPFLRGALIRKTRKRIEIRSLKSAFLSEPDNVKRLYIAPEASEKQRLWKENF